MELQEIIAQKDAEISRLSDLLRKSIDGGKEHKKTAEERLKDVTAIIEVFMELNEIMHFDEMVKDGKFNLGAFSMKIGKAMINPSKSLAPLQGFLPIIQELFAKYGPLIAELKKSKTNEGSGQICS